MYRTAFYLIGEVHHVGRKSCADETLRRQRIVGATPLGIVDQAVHRSENMHASGHEGIISSHHGDFSLTSRVYAGCKARAERRSLGNEVFEQCKSLVTQNIKKK